jgi:hypothetical protein
MKTSDRCPRAKYTALPFNAAFLLIFLIGSIHTGFAQSPNAAITLHEGELDGAPYKVAVPAE